MPGVQSCSEYKGPGPVLYSNWGGGWHKEQNKIKSGFGLNVYPTESPQSLIGTARNLLKLYAVQDIKLLVV